MACEEYVHDRIGCELINIINFMYYTGETNNILMDKRKETIANIETFEWPLFGSVFGISETSEYLPSLFYISKIRSGAYALEESLKPQSR